MDLILAILIGTLFGGGIFMLMCRAPVKLIIGLVLLSNAINLLIFVAAGMTRGKPPLIPADASTLTGAVADPLPQALILTAIVISFGVLAFALVLFSRNFKALQLYEEKETTDVSV